LLTQGNGTASFELEPKLQVSINVAALSEEVTTSNVVAILEGRDPVLRNEYVAVGAHYDHVGVGSPDQSGDRIFNGADDDGSGTVAVLAMAEALARGPRPQRSILFVWHTGEEKGLWGFEWFVEHPTVPLDQIITQLNIDMIGRSRQPGDENPRNAGLTGPDEIYVIGSRMMSSQLANLSEEVNRSYLNLKFNYKYDDPNDTERLFFRSDHYNYAKKGFQSSFTLTGFTKTTIDSQIILIRSTT
jgi:Zn-dependent M28 family amino/carboxypeptidase